MAKALFGHINAGNDLRLVAEVRRLRARIVDLEQELELARATMTVEDDLRNLTLDVSEPALT